MTNRIPEVHIYGIPHGPVSQCFAGAFQECYIFLAAQGSLLCKDTTAVHWATKKRAKKFSPPDLTTSAYKTTLNGAHRMAEMRTAHDVSTGMFVFYLSVYFKIFITSVMQ